MPKPGKRKRGASEYSCFAGMKEIRVNIAARNVINIATTKMLKSENMKNGNFPADNLDANTLRACAELEPINIIPEFKDWKLPQPSSDSWFQQLVDYFNPQNNLTFNSFTLDTFLLNELNRGSENYDKLRKQLTGSTNKLKLVDRNDYKSAAQKIWKNYNPFFDEGSDQDDDKKKVTIATPLTRQRTTPS